jgi:hypothetical protein
MLLDDVVTDQFLTDQFLTDQFLTDQYLTDQWRARLRSQCEEALRRRRGRTMMRRERTGRRAHGLIERHAARLADARRRAARSDPGDSG